MSLLFSSAPFERANPSSDDFRRPRGVSDMPGDVPDPASWVAGATKSELERLLWLIGSDVRWAVKLEIARSTGTGNLEKIR